VTGGAALRPHYDYHPLHQQADGDEADLAIVEPVIDLIISSARKHLGCRCKIQSSLKQGFFALGWIEANLHYYMYPHKGIARFLWVQIYPL